MKKLIPITPQTHKNKRWKPLTAYHFARQSALLPIVATDLMHTVMEMPVVFVKRDNKFMPAALLGYAPDSNLFIGPDGRWLGKYLPSSLRGLPFQLARNPKNYLVLCVPEDTDQITDGPEGQLIFDEYGGLTPKVERIMAFLQKVEQSRALTERACRSLDKHGIIQPWKVSLQVKSEKHALDGLYKIDENALNKISGEAFLELRQSGALPVAYSQLLSTQHVSKLGELAEDRIAEETALGKKSNPGFLLKS